MIEVTGQPQWRRAGRCGSGSCVEVAQVGDQFLVRDSKNPETRPMAFTREEWAAFVAGVREGDFDFG
ncbi:DUF397 domain-containing protein [Micromonosporaceae bacterium Da 78-11]